MATRTKPRPNGVFIGLPTIGKPAKRRQRSRPSPKAVAQRRNGHRQAQPATGKPLRVARRPRPKAAVQRTWYGKAIPPDQILKPLNSAAEYAAEARAETPIIRMSGWRYSALMHPNVVGRRYKRHNQFFGNLGVKVAILIFLTCAAIVAAVAFMVYIGTASQTGYTIKSNPVVESLLSAVIAAITCVFIGLGIWVSYQFKKAYLEVFVFERKNETEKWNTTASLGLWLPRLAFIASSQDGDYFSGPTRHSGAREGSVNLDLPLGNRVVDMKSYAEVFGLKPSISTFTEVPQRQCYQFMQECVDAGTLARFAGKSKLAKLLAENVVWIMTGICWLITFFIVMGGAQP